MVLLGIVTVYDELATVTHVVDRILEGLDVACGLNYDVEAIRVIGLQLAELVAGVLTREFDVFVSHTKRFSKLHIQSLRGTDNDVASTIKAEQLGEDLGALRPGLQCIRQ